MILWYFFHKYFIQKKKHSLYAVCHCLIEKTMASPSEFGLAIKVTDGPKTWAKTLLSKLKSVNTSDLIVDVFTGLDITFVCCVNVRCRVSMSSIFASTLASFMLKVKKKNPDWPTHHLKSDCEQSNNLFFL